MDTTILACTLTADVGLAIGYAMCSAQQFIAEGRAAVSAFLDMLEGYAPSEYERAEVPR